MKRRDIWKKILSVTRVIICKINQDPQEIAQTITQQKLQIKDANGNILQIDQLHSFSQKIRTAVIAGQKTNVQ